MTQLVLSLFPGIGLLDMAFEQEGFCVVQSRDWIMGGDVRAAHFPAGRFDGVIGGPPCQAFSSLAHMVRANGYEPKFGNLIPEFERVIGETQPQWFVMEEVPAAPRPRIDGYFNHEFTINNRQCFDAAGEPATQNRVRAITFGFRGMHRALMLDTAVFENPVYEYAATGGSHGPGGIAREMDGSYSPEAQAKALARKRGIPVLIGGSGKMKSSVRTRRNGKGGMPWNSKSKSAVEELCHKQGLSLEIAERLPYTVAAKCKAIGNGVPLPMGRAIAKAVLGAVGP